MYIYTFESKLSSENYLVFSSLLKFISLYCLNDLKLWFIVFEILVTTAQKTNSLTCSYTGLKKTYVGEVTIQMLEYYRNLLEKRFFFKDWRKQYNKQLIHFYYCFTFLPILEYCVRQKRSNFSHSTYFQKEKWTTVYYHWSVIKNH